MWRFIIYVLIDDFARYYIDLKRDNTINVVFAYIIKGYLFCIAIKKKYFNIKVIFEWLID